MLFVALFAFLLFLPGFFTVPPIDRDEARYAQATKQMVQSGDYIDIRLADDPRYKKPVGIYWLQSVAVNAFGPDFHETIWVYRLPSLVGAVAAVLLTYLIALSLAGARPALLAAMLMACCFVLGAEARLAKTDAMLLLSILGAQWVLARLWMQGPDAIKGAWPYLFWAALAVSVLVKGPIGPMVVGLTVAGLVVIRRGIAWLNALRPLRGGILFLAIAVPWFVLITLKSGMAFWDAGLGDDLIAKIGEGQENHGAPFGAHTALVWLTFWPASIFLPFGIWYAWTGRREPMVLFCLVWILPSWLVFEITATKLIHYVLPMFPALAILSAKGWLERPDGRPSIAYLLGLLALLAVAFVFAAASVVVSLQAGTWPGLIWGIGAVISTLGVWWVWSTMRSGGRFAPFVGLGALAIGLGISVYSHLARVDYMWPSGALAALQATGPQCDGRGVVGLGYEEPSLLFLSDQYPQFVGFDAVVNRVLAADCAVAHIEAQHKGAFEAAIVARNSSVLGTVDGYDLGRARHVVVTVYGID